MSDYGFVSQVIMTAVSGTYIVQIIIPYRKSHRLNYYPRTLKMFKFYGLMMTRSVGEIADHYSLDRKLCNS